MIQVKQHALTNFNVHDGIGNLMGGEKANIFYSDPPWGEGNLRYWQTINHRHNGIEAKEVNLVLFLRKIFSLAKENTSGAVFIEYGIKWEKEIIEMGQEAGLFHLGVATIKYRSGSKFLPHQLHIFHTNGNLTLPSGFIEGLTGMTGVPCLEKAVAPFVVSNGIVLDPCCGLGMTSRLAVKVGMRFRGNELNPKRLSVTENWLRKNG